MRATGAPLEGHDLGLAPRAHRGVARSRLPRRARTPGRRRRARLGIVAAGDDRDLVDYLSGELLDAPAARAALLPPADVGPGPIRAAVRRGARSPGFGAGDRRARALEPLRPAPRSPARAGTATTTSSGRSFAPSSSAGTPRSVPSLHRRASRWHEREGTPEEAVQHALAAREMRRAAELVVHTGRGLVLFGRVATVRRWLQAFPDDNRQLRAAGLDRGLGCRPVRGEGPGAAVRLGRRRRAMAGAGVHGRAVARARRGAHQGGVRLGGCEPDARRRAHRLSAPPRRTPRARARGGRPRLQPDVARAGTAEAVPLLEEASALGAARAVASILALGVLAQIALEEGRLDVAEARVREGLALIDGAGLGDHTATVSVDTAVACLGAQSGDLMRARIHLVKARSALPLVAASPWRSIRTRALLGAVAVALGDLPLADRCWTRPDGELAGYPDAGGLPGCSPERSGRSSGPAAAAACWQAAHSRRAQGAGAAADAAVPGRVGETLHSSRNTVKAQVRSIYMKLDVSGRTDAVARARRHGLLARGGQSPTGGDAPPR